MEMEERVRLIETWKNEVHPKIERLSNDLATNTGVTKATSGKVDALAERLAPIEVGVNRILLLFSVTKMGGAGLKWLVGLGANLIVVLGALHYLK